MIEPKYAGLFTNREDVAREFEEIVGAGWNRAQPITVNEGFPTDEQILFAAYDLDSYDGSAFVLFEREGKLYEVNGSHCSCYGLEGQWKPEETTWKALAIRNPSFTGVRAQVIDEAKTHIEE